MSGNLGLKLPVNASGVMVFFEKFVCLFRERERERKRERERIFQAGSVPPAQSLMWDSNSRTARS